MDRPDQSQWCVVLRMVDGFHRADYALRPNCSNGVNGPNAQYWLSSTVNCDTSPAAEYNNGPAYNDGNVNFLANQFVLVAGVDANSGPGGRRFESSLPDQYI